MYSPTTRLLTVLELLQSQARLSGAELARRLEVDVRTVRRYLVRLQEMGIPIEAEPGRHGGYRLGKGHRMPPLMLGDQEAVALTLGLMLIRELGLSVARPAVISALSKTERLLPEHLQPQVQALQQAITFRLNLYPANPTALAIITTLSQQAQQRRAVYLRYQAWDQAQSERVFEPYGIVMNEGVWYTAGFCQKRQALRTFRLDRIQELQALETPFERPEVFDTLAYVLKGLSQSGGEDIEILLQCSLAEASKHCDPALGNLEPTSEGVLLRRQSHNLHWLAQWLMYLELPLQVRKPLALREILHARGLAALRMAGLTAKLPADLSLEPIAIQPCRTATD